MAEFKLTDETQTAETTEIFNRLVEHNREVLGPSHRKPLHVLAYENERLIGGLSGHTHWGWLYISILYVDKSARKQKIGKELLLRAEHEAQARGCQSALVDTMSAEAAKFYRDNGYQEFGCLPDYPRGTSRWFFSKHRLDQK